ncbi:MAG: GreA/GreB family elongation factor, partial [Pyrinomonadaceae bacterium]
IDVATLNERGKVVFGATVEIMNLGTEEVVTYQIVGEDEADIKIGLISVGSPIARALISKKIGDTALVQAPAGAVEYEILDVRYEASACE